MTKYRKGPQRTHKGPQRSITGKAAGNWHQLNSMVPYIPVRAKIFHMLPDLVENLHSLIASQYAEADRAICGRVNFIRRLSHQKHRFCVANWKALSQRQRVRHAVFSLACEGVAAWHAAINIY